MANSVPAKAFLEAIKQNPELQKQLTLVDWDEETAMQMAHDMGFDFDIDDLLNAIDEQSDELSEADLAKMSGGWAVPPSL